MSTTTTTTAPRLSLRPSLVRPLLVLDAAVCLGLGAVGTLGSDRLAAPLGAPQALLVLASLALVVYGAGAAYVSRGVTRPRLIGLVGLNTAFAVGSGVSVLAAPLTGWGTAVALALAVVSLVVADLLVLGARGRH